MLPINPLVCSMLTKTRLNTKIGVRNLEVKDLVPDLSDGVSRAYPHLYAMLLGLVSVFAVPN